MSAAHLHAVPDPDSDPRPPADDQLEDSPVGDVDGGQEHRGWIPNLRPYFDVRPLAELGPLAVEATRLGGPPLLRATGRGLRALAGGLFVLARGVGVLLVLLAGWWSGRIGKHGSIGARFAGAGLIAYAVVKTAVRYPGARWSVLLALLAAVILAGLGHIKAPELKQQKQTPAKKKGAGEKGKGAPGGDDEETPEVSKEDAPAEPRRGPLGRLARRLKSGGDTPAKPSPDDADETPVEPSPDPSPEDLARALHHLYRGGSGVLHTALAEHLPLPSTKAVKRVLDGAGIAHRPGVRTPVGNGPGVHHHDFPPLPLSQEGPQGEGCWRRSEPTPTPTTPPTAPGGGLSAYRTEWTREELEKGHRIVPDTDRGPAAWKIEHRRTD
ncbi:hypothetical protein ACFVW5_04845 [Streptomyces sp. NPDC058232]|uniref:hypothetical protein n=1 Tax=Streptomyces sp. NPDC058232 TaxID=3346393 RepID=UPI0036E517F9